MFLIAVVLPLKQIVSFVFFPNNNCPRGACGLKQKKGKLDCLIRPIPIDK